MVALVRARRRHVQSPCVAVTGLSPHPQAPHQDPDLQGGVVLHTAGVLELSGTGVLGASLRRPPRGGYTQAVAAHAS